jgi:peptidoglycan/LPS O-acetylase OafA/YrhL
MALLVVWSHSFALWLGSEDSEPVSLLFGGIYNIGNLGVLAFLTISGFLITLSWLRAKSWIKYLRRRFLRIYPGYLFAILVCSLVVVPGFSSRQFFALSANEIGGLLSNLLLRNYILSSDAFGGGPVNGSLWSIPYEFWCYLGVLALGAAGLFRWRLIYPLLIVTVMAIRVWLDLTGRRPGGGLVETIFGFPYLWFNVLPPFLLGGAVYLYRDRLPRSALLLAYLILATVAAGHLPLSEIPRTTLTRLLMPLTLTYVIFYVAFSPALRVHDAARYGDFSYGTYLYAFPIQQMFAAMLKSQVNFAVYVLLCLVASLLAGVASWHLVEKWFLPRLRRTGALEGVKRPLENEAAIVAP